MMMNLLGVTSSSRVDQLEAEVRGLRALFGYLESRPVIQAGFEAFQTLEYRVALLEAKVASVPSANTLAPILDSLKQLQRQIEDNRSQMQAWLSNQGPSGTTANAPVKQDHREVAAALTQSNSGSGDWTIAKYGKMQDGKHFLQPRIVTLLTIL